MTWFKQPQMRILKGIKHPSTSVAKQIWLIKNKQISRRFSIEDAH